MIHQFVDHDRERRWLCPTCRQLLDAAWTCPKGHHYEEVDGVRVLLTPSFRARLQDFLDAFHAYREVIGRRLLDPDSYPQLPYGPGAGRHIEWRLRQHDLSLVRRLLAGRRRRVLEVGAWNGWLSHWLTRDGHEVTAVDYFVDPYDGLQAMRHYPVQWRLVQADLEDLEPLGGPYDAVVVNRCLAFFCSPPATLQAALDLLAPGGCLIVTGVLVHRRSDLKARQVAAERAAMQGHGVGTLKEMKGFLDQADLTTLRQTGVLFRWMPGLLLANLRASIDRRRPRHVYGYAER